MEDKLNKTLIDSLSGYINPKTKKPIHNPKKMKRQEEKSDDEDTTRSNTAPRNVPSGYDIWRPNKPLNTEKK